MLHILSVFHANGNVHTAMRLLAIVHDITARQGSIGQINDFVIDGTKHGVEDLDTIHYSSHILSLDVIAHLEGFEQQDDETACKIAEIPTQGHTCSHAHRRQQSSKRRGVDAQSTYHSHYQEHCEQYVDKTLQESLDGWVYISAFEGLCQQFVEK